jgi:hypothetical protein
VKYLILLLMCLVACGKDDNDAPTTAAVAPEGEPETEAAPINELTEDLKLEMAATIVALKTIKIGDTFQMMTPEAQKVLLEQGRAFYDVDDKPSGYEISKLIDPKGPVKENCYFTYMVFLDTDRKVDAILDNADNSIGCDISWM